MPKPYLDLSLLAPELTIAAVALAVLILDLLVAPRFRKEIAAVACAGLVLALVPTLWLWGHEAGSDFSGALLIDNLALAFIVLFIVGGAMIVLMSPDYLRNLRRGFGEYFALVAFMVLALCFMASAGDLIVLYIAFEMSSIIGYVLATWMRDEPRGNEAGMKYFIYGASSSAVLLYGLSLLYGATGTVLIRPLAQTLALQPSILGVVGAALVIAGLGYKISMVPFHWWTPDVYEGAPTPVTALLSVGPKLAGFAILIRLMSAIHATAPFAWPVALGLLATATMFAGNLLAIHQRNIKRLLAYSSIAHAGYLLIGIIVAFYDPLGLQAFLYYAAAYLFMNLGAFAVALVVEAQTGSSDLDDFAGLARRAPWLAAAMMVFLVSLVGIPPTGGFVGKLLLFGAAIKYPKLAWLAVVGVINSAISLYYYMQIARSMYFSDTTIPARRAVPASLAVAVWLALIGTLALFVGAGPVTVWVEEACRKLAGS
jgi:NADH-quinone oxidoreductase subunit N